MAQPSAVDRPARPMHFHNSVMLSGAGRLARKGNRPNEPRSSKSDTLAARYLRGFSRRPERGVDDVVRSCARRSGWHAGSICNSASGISCAERRAVRRTARDEAGFACSVQADDAAARPVREVLE
jgi:hypothetical protein